MGHTLLPHPDSSNLRGDQVRTQTRRVLARGIEQNQRGHHGIALGLGQVLLCSQPGNDKVEERGEEHARDHEWSAADFIDNEHADDGGDAARYGGEKGVGEGEVAETHLFEKGWAIGVHFCRANKNDKSVLL